MLNLDAVLTAARRLPSMSRSTGPITRRSTSRIPSPGRGIASVSPASGAAMTDRSTPSNSAALSGKYRYSVPFATPARVATSAMRVAANPWPRKTSSAASTIRARVSAVLAGLGPRLRGGISSDTARLPAW